MRQKRLSITRSLIIPSICTLCNQFHTNSLAVCSHCIALIKPLGFACNYCAQPLLDDHYPICGQCIIKPPHFDKALVSHAFEEPLRGLLHQFKYHSALYLRSFLCELILASFSDYMTKAQCLIPVPMHPKKLKERGFNQAAVLAKFLAQQLNLPYDLTSCKKIKNTLPQASLNNAQRQQNLRAAFHSKTLPYQHVILIDDLLTTGSTANELALCLKKTGVQRVDICCCARTVKQ